ncbi:MAG: hypothetical protein WBP45_13270 [Daejeonella sp.]
MKKQTIIIDYSHEADNDLDNLAQTAFDALENNADFTFEAGVLPDLQTSINDYRFKLNQSKNGSSADKAAKNEAKEVLADQLKEVAIQVNLQADGDALKLMSSGFRLAKTGAPVGILPKPTGFSVKSGKNSGELMLSVDANKNATMYYFYTAPVPAPANLADWRLTPSTKSSINIAGFTPGKQYECKCAYKGSAEELVYSDSILIYAQ